jgi:hypothetical protein
MDRPKNTPIACTLEGDALPERLREWQAVFEHVETRRATPDGVTLRFPSDPDVLAAVSAVAAKEVACCSFFTFTLTIDAQVAWLSVGAPADAVPLVRTLFSAVDG